jgi:hypothetical protein
MLMDPAHVHRSLQLFVSVGIDPVKTVGAPGIQGATVIGTHGIGVKTPKAAAVAAMTVGLLGLEHIPKVGIFDIGM